MPLQDHSIQKQEEKKVSLFHESKADILRQNPKAAFRKLSYSKPLVLFSSALLCFGAGAAFLYASAMSEPATALQEIRITGRTYLEKKELAAILALRKGQRYSKNDLLRARDLLLEHPMILLAELRQEAATLHVRIQERQCAALIEDSDTKAIYDIDKDGAVLSEKSTRCRKVPLLRGAFKKKGKHFQSENAKRMLKALTTIQAAYPELSSHFSEWRMNAEGSISIFLRQASLRVLVPVEINKKLVDRLYAALSYALKKKRPYSLLDLRSSEAVLYKK